MRKAAQSFPVVTLGELVPEDATSFANVDFAQAALKGDVALGLITDEELFWAADETGAPDPFTYPRLSTLNDNDRRVALETAMWLLQARGDLLVDPDTTEVSTTGALATIGGLRSNAQAMIAIRTDRREAGTEHALLYRIQEDLFLTEDLSDVGLHRFTLRGLERMARWFAAAVDPHACAAMASAVQRAARAEDLQPTPDALVAAARSSAVAEYGEAGERRSFTAYGDNQGLHLLRGWQEGAAQQYTLRSLTPQELVDLCAAYATSAEQLHA